MDLNLHSLIAYEMFFSVVIGLPTVVTCKYQPTSDRNECLSMSEKGGVFAEQ